MAPTHTYRREPHRFPEQARQEALAKEWPPPTGNGAASLDGAARRDGVGQGARERLSRENHVRIT